MANEFESRSVIVYGGTGGIGLATAEAFTRLGAHVTIVGRDEERGELALQGLKTVDPQAAFVAADVQDTAAVDGAVENVLARFGQLDIAFNNAGWEGTPGPVEMTSESDWTKMIDIKLNGLWRCVAAELRAMKSQGHGAIVNMAGNWGLIGFPNFAAYCAAAHGIVGLTKAAAMEVASSGIRINAVCPGAVDAPMLDRMVGGDENIKQSFGEQLAVGRICRPDEVANAVLWLASAQATYVNGTSIPLDGGGSA